MNAAAYFDESSCNITDFEALCTSALSVDECPNAQRIVKNIPIYDAVELDFNSAASRQMIMGEWAANLLRGSGVIVIKNAQPDHDAIDGASEAFFSILKEEEQQGVGAGDHFAKAGTNGRIWNALQKLCEKSPKVFARYHGSVAIHTAAQAWLGPHYQMTAQVNLVHPGGAAQQAHRDYHLGFMTNEMAKGYPAHTHLLSPFLTLQGALAHVDIAVEAGPTKLLPFSQRYEPGYVAWRRDDFRDYFEKHCVQLPLNKGDAVFFNPALFHAGGDNRTEDVLRLVNLFQVSSAMGRAMESVDRFAMCSLLYPILLKEKMDAARIEASLASCAEGYAFPTNLDSDPPIGGLSPQTQADIMREGLLAGTDAATVIKKLEALHQRQTP